MSKMNPLQRALSILAAILVAVSLFSTPAYCIRINSITITVVPNPYHVQATVTAVFNTTPMAWQIGNVNLTVRLWDEDTFADDDLGGIAVVVPPGGGIPNQVWTINCDDDDNVQGPGGSSGENTAELYVQVDGHAAKSNVVEVTQQECDIGRLEMSGPDNVVVGNDVLVTFAVGDTSILFSVDSLNFGVTYDPSRFSVVTASFANLMLAQYGTISYLPGTVRFKSDLPLPINLQGYIGRIQFHCLPGGQEGSEYSFDYTPDSHFYHPQAQPVVMSFFANHTITVLPVDNLPPIINVANLSYSQYHMSGSAGAVTDNWMNIPHGLYVELLDNNDSAMGFSYVDNNGGFYMDEEWLVSGTQAKLRATDVGNNHTEFVFLVPTSYLPVLLDPVNGTTAPGTSGHIGYSLFNRCDLTTGYILTATGTQPWLLGPQMQQVTLPSFVLNNNFQVSVSVPSNALPGMVDSIRVIATSMVDPSSKDTLWATLTVTGQVSLDVTLVPINPPIVVPSNGGSFNFNASVMRTVGPQVPFTVWARIKNPNGTYTPPTLGPVQISPPVGVLVTRQRTQNVPSIWPPGQYTYLGYANMGFGYPAIDSSSFTFTKAVLADGGPFIQDASCSGELFEGEIPVVTASSALSLKNLAANPFNPTAVLSFDLWAPGFVSLKVYDTVGRVVATLMEETRQVGTHQVTFDGSNLPTGIYIARLQAGGASTVQKLVLMK